MTDPSPVSPDPRDPTAAQRPPAGSGSTPIAGDAAALLGIGLPSQNDQSTIDASMNRPEADRPRGSRFNRTRGFNRFIAPSAEELRGMFPQLEILELLGQGGMGAVYKAKQRGLDRLVAVKILPPEFGEIPGFADRFTREARALAKLNHPNIVSVFDFGRTAGFSIEQGATSTISAEMTGPGSEGLYYLVMEYVDGVNLRQAMRQNKLSPTEALAIVPQICEALQFAHDEGIVHRDIKPENILLDKRGKVKIADFGLVKLVTQADDDITLTREGGTMGTPHYMAPEQIEGAHAVDHRADIYSLGVVFYEMLTGELPLGRFAAPSKKVKIDVRLDEIVMRTLEKEPELRYQHASEVKTQVDGIRGMSPQLLEGIQRAAGREYKSKMTLFGWPLLHIAFGIDPSTGRKRVAKGVVAIGDVAVGAAAVGGVAVGGIACGGVGVGILSFSGLAIGVLAAIGGFAIGGFAWGGFAVGVIASGGFAVGYYAHGGFGVGANVLASNTQDAAAERFFSVWARHWNDWFLMLAIAFPVIFAAISAFAWAVLRTKGRIGGGFDDDSTAAQSPHGARRGNTGRSADAAPKAAVPAASPGDQSAHIRRQLLLPALATCLIAPLFLFLTVLCGANGIDIADGNDRTPVVQGYMLIGAAIASLLIFALVLRGAWHMFSLTRHGPAVLAGFLTFPIGIWALVVLGRRDVREAFSEHVQTPPATLAVKKPFSVMVMSVCNILLGFALLFLISIATLPMESNEAIEQLWEEATPAHDIVRTIERVSVPFQYIAACLLIVSGIGLLMWQSWGRKLTIGVCLYMLLDFFIQVPVIVLGTFVPLWKLAADPRVYESWTMRDASEAMTFALVQTVTAIVIGLGLLIYFIVQMVVLQRPHVAAAFSPNGWSPALANSDAERSTESDRSSFVCAIIAMICFLIGVLAPMIIVAVRPDRDFSVPVALFGVSLFLSILFGLLGHRHRLGRLTLGIALIIGVGVPSVFFVTKSAREPVELLGGSHPSVTYLSGHTSIVKGVAVSRDGKTLASVGMDGKLIVRDLPSGDVRFISDVTDVSPNRSGSPLFCVTITSAGDVLAGGNPESVSILKTNSTHSTSEAITVPTRGSVRGIMSFDRGRKFAYVAGDTEIVFYDPAEQRAIARAPIYPNKAFGNVRSVAGSPDGRFIAVTSSNMTGDGPGGAKSIGPCMLTVYDDTGELRLSFQIDQYADFSFAQIVFADARTLVMCLPSGRMQQWKLGNDDEWALVATPSISPGRYTAIAASNDGKMIWLAHQEEIVGIDAETGEGIAFVHVNAGKRAKEFASFPIESIAATGKPLQIAAALWDGRVALADCVPFDGSRQPDKGYTPATTADVALVARNIEFRIAPVPAHLGEVYPEPGVSGYMHLAPELSAHGPTALHRRESRYRWFELTTEPLVSDINSISGRWNGKHFMLLSNESAYILQGGKPAAALIDKTIEKTTDKVPIETTETSWRIAGATMHPDASDATRFRVHVKLDAEGSTQLKDLTRKLQGHRLAIIARGKCMGVVSVQQGAPASELDFEGLTRSEATALVAALKE